LIAGGIILFIILLLAVPVVIRFEYGSTLLLKVRYLFITVYRFPPKPKKKKKRKKSKKKKRAKSDSAAQKKAAAEPTSDAAAAEASAEAAPEKDEEPKKEKKQKKEKNPKIPTLTEIFELLKALVDGLSKPLKKLLKRIHINDFRLEMVCGGDDAAKAALKFGAVNLAVGNALGHLGSWFTMKDPHIDIGVDFQSERTDVQCSCTVKVSALVLLIFVFDLVFRLLWRALRSDVIMGYLGRLKGGKAKK